jgi:hypothetical protein
VTTTRFYCTKCDRQVNDGRVCSCANDDLRARIADLEADLECCDCADHVVRIASLEAEVAQSRVSVAAWIKRCEASEAEVERLREDNEELRRLLGDACNDGQFVSPAVTARIEAALKEDDD